ncbi:MAG: GGDEF domain-containing protein [Planctomycetota bacterium]|nr:GGDEF domain-containing protein [Planctomycetota bacterium]
MTSNLCILISDHRGEGLGEALKGLIGAGMDIHQASNLKGSREHMSRFRPQVVILDPLASGGTKEIETIWAVADSHAPALLLVTDPSRVDAAATAQASLRDIPMDLIRRDASLDEFRVRVRALASRYTGESELEELRYQASHDDRTGLLRPVPFTDRLEEHFSAAARHKLPLALILMDLDRFGQINKQYDHTVGDRVIEGVGKLVRLNLRTEDIGGRLGGDEFGLLLPYTTAVDAARVVRRVRDRMRSLITPVEQRDPVVVTASLGFESFDGTDLQSADEMRLRAEKALRAAKTARGDQGIYFRSLGEDLHRA